MSEPIITFDATRFNDGGGAWNGTTYTVPRAGLYEVAYRVTAQRSARGCRSACEPNAAQPSMTTPGKAVPA